MNIVTHDRATRRQNTAASVGRAPRTRPRQVPADPVEAVDRYWKPISAEQLERRNAGQPLTHRLVRLPNISRRSGRVLGPLNGLLVDG